MIKLTNQNNWMDITVPVDTTQVSVTIPYRTDKDLDVYQGTRKLGLGAEYTISGNPLLGQSVVTFVVTVPARTRLFFIRNTDEVRVTDFERAAYFEEKLLDAEFDSQIRMIQDSKMYLTTSAHIHPTDISKFTTQLPPAFANAVICVNEANDAFTYVDLSQHPELLEFLRKCKEEADRAKAEADRAAKAAAEAKTSAEYVDSVYSTFSKLAENQKAIETIAIGNKTVITFKKVFVNAATIFVSGKNVDQGRLHPEVDYKIDGINQITLARRYPPNTFISAEQYIKHDTDSTASVWNRRVIDATVGNTYAQYKDGDRTLEPRLRFEDQHYLPLFDSSTPVLLNGLPVKLDNGVIRIHTNKGDKDFSRVIAEAISQETGIVARGSTASRKLADRFADTLSMKDFGAVGDGVTDEQAVFDALEAGFTNKTISLEDKTYRVTKLPIKNKYTNGHFKIGDRIHRALFDGAPMCGGGRIAMGKDALAALPRDYDVGEFGLVVAMGAGALSECTRVKKTIAIGTNAQGNSPCSRDNIAIGEDTLRFVAARTPDYDQKQQQGTRNIAIGGNSGRFVREGSHNVSIGRNAGQCVLDGKNVTAIGSNAVGGNAPIGLSGVIENWAPFNDTDGTTAVGSEALQRVITGYNVAIGNKACRRLVVGRGNVAMGPNTLQQMENNLSFNGGIQTNVEVDGTYNHAGTTLTISLVSATSIKTGDIVGIRLLDGGSQTFQGDVCPATVVSVSGNTFTVTHPVSRQATGTAKLYWISTGASGPKSEFNTAIGGKVAINFEIGSENTVIGYASMIDAVSTDGAVSRNSAIGFRALSGTVKPTYCTALGHDALRVGMDGQVATAPIHNCTGVGAGSRISGDNQVQLGNWETTTYCFGTVQNRSDARDKIDVEDTALGIDFILGLRPVDGRWDLREAYSDTDGDVTKSVAKDGSRARKRKHHWFIAQEVKALCDKMGVEFGGYQDHKVNGGADVLTLGYDEFIPPMTKAIQDCWKRMDEMEKQTKAIQDCWKRMDEMEKQTKLAMSKIEWLTAKVK
ncbi:MAG: hypothetical protein ACRC42_01265 [Mycoplasma sp.]